MDAGDEVGDLPHVVRFHEIAPRAHTGIADAVVNAALFRPQREFVPQDILPAVR